MAENHRSKSLPEAQDVVGVVDELLQRAVACGASDVHFEPTGADLRVKYRLDGVLSPVESLPAAVAENVVARLKVLGGLLTYRNDIPQEGRLELNGQGFGQGHGRSLGRISDDLWAAGRGPAVLSERRADGPGAPRVCGCHRIPPEGDCGRESGCAAAHRPGGQRQEHHVGGPAAPHHQDPAGQEHRDPGGPGRNPDRRGYPGSHHAARSDDFSDGPALSCCGRTRRS